LSAELLSLDDQGRWLELEALLPPASRDVYFLPAYLRLHQQMGHGQAFCWAYREGPRLALWTYLARPIAPLGFRLPAGLLDIEGPYGYNGPQLSHPGEPDFALRMAEAFGRHCASQGVVASFMRFHPLLGNHLANGHQALPNRQTVVVELEPPAESIWAGQYDSNNRNSIRKALKLGVEVRPASGADDYLRFAALYRQTMADLGAEDFYFFPDSYFLGLRQLLPAHHLLLLAWQGPALVAGLILLHHGPHAHYHLSARDAAARLNANNLLLHEAILRAKALGCRRMHLGGGASTRPDDPLMAFKSRFSPHRLDFFIGKKVFLPEEYALVIRQWEERFPEKVAAKGQLLLRYRY